MGLPEQQMIFQYLEFQSNKWSVRDGAADEALLTLDTKLAI
jgi:hypothetical protein